jgi:hypothetical protein
MSSGGVLKIRSERDDLNSVLQRYKRVNLIGIGVVFAKWRSATRTLVLKLIDHLLSSVLRLLEAFCDGDPWQAAGLISRFNHAAFP